MKTGIGTVVGAVILGVGIALCGWFVGQGFYAAHFGDRYVSVKGLAERNVTSDLAIWPLRFVASGNQLAQVQATIRREATDVTGFLRAQGIAAGDIQLQSLEVTDRDAQLYGGNDKGDRFIITQTLMVRSQAVDKVAAASQHIGKLVDRGVILDSNRASGPSYLYTRLNAIKPDMIAQATKAARAAAAQFAQDSGANLGGIRRANQGVFQILARDNAPGINADKQVAKTVRVVSHVQYYLTND